MAGVSVPNLPKSKWTWRTLLHEIGGHAVISVVLAVIGGIFTTILKVDRVAAVIVIAAIVFGALALYSRYRKDPW
jgi:FtsH-binding integral membrane protein